MKPLPIILTISFLTIALLAPISAHAINIWESTTGWNATEGTGCNAAPHVCDLKDFLIVASNIIGFLFRIAIPLAVLMIAFGAFTLMLARGSQDKVAKAKTTITSAVIGLVITLSAWLIVNIIVSILAKKIEFPDIP